VTASQRRLLPLIEALRAEFELSREELRDVDRGATTRTLATSTRAAARIATAEEHRRLQRVEGAIRAIGAEASPH